MPTGMGGTGFEGVRSFYRTWFVGRNAADLNVQSVSWTVGDMTVVDELLLSFTHDIEVPWILPGVAATGRRVDIPVIAVVGFEGTAVAYEHVYWDQAVVLAQVDLLDRATVARLPIVTAPRALLDGSEPLNQLAQAD
ncbi:nuclear transport factor 2 family protein [Streptomyces sp. NPDC007875]|uniref:nuclear transport factor 2 family protein n=1 Tax=Streptomyces sp. NPDC007875 TaxID=3364783 RepID=UPI0036A055CE